MIYKTPKLNPVCDPHETWEKIRENWVGTAIQKSKAWFDNLELYDELEIDSEESDYFNHNKNFEYFESVVQKPLDKLFSSESSSSSEKEDHQEFKFFPKFMEFCKEKISEANDQILGANEDPPLKINIKIEADLLEN